MRCEQTKTRRVFLGSAALIVAGLAHSALASLSFGFRRRASESVPRVSLRVYCNAQVDDAGLRQFIHDLQEDGWLVSIRYNRLTGAPEVSWDAT